MVILKIEQRGGLIKKFLIILIISITGLYFGVGYYVYGVAASVPCEVWIEEAENTPDNWSLGNKASWDPSEYFVNDYEEVTILADNGEIEILPLFLCRFYLILTMTLLENHQSLLKLEGHNS